VCGRTGCALDRESQRSTFDRVRAAVFYLLALFVFYVFALRRLFGLSSGL